MKSISIIVPIYNSEKYIDKCITSILSQSFRDFELILVDDGSTDNSLTLMKKHTKDERVKIISQKNAGPAIARNNGMNVANGTYIMFIDSDDYIDKNFVEIYFNNINNTDFDIVMGGYKKITGDHIDFIRKNSGGVFAKYLVVGPVCKIYKRSFILKNNIDFPNITSSEDVAFNMEFIKYSAKIKTIDNTGYYYFFNPSSISNTSHKGFNENVDILDLMNKINYNNLESPEIHQYFIIRYIIWYLLYSGKNTSSNSFYSEYVKYFTWLDDNCKNFSKNKYIRPLGPSGDQKSIGCIIFTFMLFHKMKAVKLFSKLYCKGKKQ